MSETVVQASTFKARCLALIDEVEATHQRPARGFGPARSADLTPTVGVAAGELDQFHGDPADRLIYATAMLSRIPLATKDRLLREFAADDGQVSVVW
ncbi:hypothetical protein [Iamia sp.]|uniref:hypothetical protein n=1 Tax=Iamia sp. TaxID=2722710 RepID=UPI002B67B71B|nr:hypothetical protein [Iamia sp.]HXH55836.1 hypothetical protein [Iamia sp.]